jgi:hypothetical protein
MNEKTIDTDRFMLLSNSDTEKIALLMENTQGSEIKQAMEKFVADLQIKNITSKI